MNPNEYWEEVIAQTAEECDLVISKEQLIVLAEAVRNSHDNYGMAFYSPPASDRIAGIQRGFEKKISDLTVEHEKYRENAEKAIKQALRQHPDAQVSIGEHGEVTRHDGRMTQIQ